MLILGIDTSSREATIALLRAPEAAEALSGHMETLELVSLQDGRASELLMPAVAALLARHGISQHALSLVGVASGPGSFTGLRVALATAKGLAEALAIAVVAVSVLEAVALAAAVEGRAVAALDAQRGEVFFGEYTFDQDGAHRLREDLSPFENFVAEFPPGVHLVTSDECLGERLREAGLQPMTVTPPGAGQIAEIAYRKYLAGQHSDVATMDANYLRRSDAEIVFSRKRADPKHGRETPPQ